MGTSTKAGKSGYRVLIATLIGVASLSLLSPQANEASAYILNPQGCKFPGTNPDIRYKFNSVAANYVTATHTARNRWNNSNPATPGTFISSTTSSPEINVFSGFYATTNLAWVGGACNSGTKLWNEPLELHWNRNQLDSSTGSRRAAVGVHEFGHSLGLGHAGGNSCNLAPVPSPYGPARAIMNNPPWWAQENCSGNPIGPYIDDINGANVIY